MEMIGATIFDAGCETLWNFPFVPSLLRLMSHAFPTNPPGATEAAQSRERRRVYGEEDTELARCLARQDEQSFAIVYRQLSGRLFSLIFRILQNEGEAEDVLQETFVQMWKNAGSYDASRSAVFTWAVMIARNRAIDRVRSRQRRFRLLESATREAEATEPPPAPQADELHAREDEGRRVRAAMSGINEAQREAVELAFFGGLTQVEIAERTGAPLGTIKARIRRGLLALREILKS